MNYDSYRDWNNREEVSVRHVARKHLLEEEFSNQTIHEPVRQESRDMHKMAMGALVITGVRKCRVVICFKLRFGGERYWIKV